MCVWKAIDINILMHKDNCCEMLLSMKGMLINVTWYFEELAGHE